MGGKKEVAYANNCGGHDEKKNRATENMRQWWCLGECRDFVFDFDPKNN